MKFDVVVGNPPYNPPTKENAKNNGSGNKIWQYFVEASIHLLNEGGYVSMVTPNNWRTGKFSKGLHRRAQEMMFDLNVMHWADANKYFDGIGTEVDWWVIQNAPSTMKNIIRSNALLSHNSDEESMNIIENWLIALENDCYIQNIGANDPRRFVHTRGNHPINSTHVYKHVITGSKAHNGEFDWYDTKTEGFDKKKVIFFYSSGPRPLYDKNGKIGCGHDARAFEVENDEEAKEIIDFFSSKLCNFVIEIVSTRLKGFRCPVQMFKRIPKNWRKLEEKHFG